MPFNGANGSVVDTAGLATRRGAQEMIDAAEKWADVLKTVQPKTTGQSSGSDPNETTSNGLVKWVDVASST